tara:strand:- start:185 stop:1177 length:993 start_codon:yes stop_codon:yes gene_type:complete
MSFSETYSTSNPGSAVSNREDLLDVLTILAPEETPILSMANKKKATAVQTEWTVDKYRTPSTAGVAEGADVTTYTDAFKERARLSNYQQKFRSDYMVSDIQEAVDSVGPADIAQAETKSIQELKRDIEATLCSDNDRAVENGAGTVYKLRGLGEWLKSTGPADVPSNYRTPADSLHLTGAFTETVLNTMITSCFRVTGSTNNLTLVADTALRRKISDFARLDPDGDTVDTSIRNVNYSGKDAEIKLSVEVYKSHHGNVAVVNMNPDCAPDTVNTDTGFLLNPTYYGVAELIPVGTRRLEDQGGGPRGFVDCMLTLTMNHPQAHGMITAVA